MARRIPHQPASAIQTAPVRKRKSASLAVNPRLSVYSFSAISTVDNPQSNLFRPGVVRLETQEVVQVYATVIVKVS